MLVFRRRFQLLIRRRNLLPLPSSSWSSSPYQPRRKKKELNMRWLNDLLKIGCGFAKKMFSLIARGKAGGKYFRIIKSWKSCQQRCSSTPFIDSSWVYATERDYFRTYPQLFFIITLSILFTFICDSKNSSLRVLNRPTERRTAPRFLTDRLFFLRLRAAEFLCDFAPHFHFM